MEDTRKQLIQFGFDSQVVDVALREVQAEIGVERATVNEIVEWILQHETAIRLQIEHDSGAALQALGGLERVFVRERKRVEEFSSLVEDGLHSPDTLSVLADEIENFTHSLVDRRRLNGETEDDIMEDMLHRSQMAPMSMEASLNTSGPTQIMDPRTRAWKIGRVLGPCSRASHGVLSLSEAYRIFNRSHPGDIVTPDEFIRACAHFEAVGVPMRLERGALFLSDGAADDIVTRMVAKISRVASGASRVDVSSQMGIPVGIAALYLNWAESRALVVRDETARGVYYHTNKFMTFDTI